MIGVGVQQAFILLFLVFAIKFHRTILQQSAQSNHQSGEALTLLYVLYFVLLLISVSSTNTMFNISTNRFMKTRIIFRLCEYSQGLTSKIPNHEAFQYCLDSLPMLLCLYLLNVWHPGRIMRGKESDIPSRKERKLRSINEKSESGPVELSNQMGSLFDV